MDETIACVIYEDPRLARGAWRSLRRSGLKRPAKVSLHQGDLSQDQYTVAQSHSRWGAIAGSLTVGIPTAIFLGFAASVGVLASLPTTLAVMTGLLGGGLLGGLTGMLVGSTEPRSTLARARDAVRDGKIALVAQYDDAEQARRAERLLCAQPGARGCAA